MQAQRLRLCVRRSSRLDACRQLAALHRCCPPLTAAQPFCLSACKPRVTARSAYAPGLQFHPLAAPGHSSPRSHSRPAHCYTHTAPQHPRSHARSSHWCSSTLQWTSTPRLHLYIQLYAQKPEAVTHTQPCSLTSSTCDTTVRIGPADRWDSKPDVSQLTRRHLRSSCAPS